MQNFDCCLRKASQDADATDDSEKAAIRPFFHWQILWQGHEFE